MEPASEESSDPSGNSARRRHPIRWFAAAGMTVLVPFLLATKGEKIPKFEGRSLSVYLPDLRAGRGQPQYDAAVHAVTMVGANGLPYYVREAYGPPPWYETYVTQARVRYPNVVTVGLNNWMNSSEARMRKLGAHSAIRLLAESVDSSPITNDLAIILRTATDRNYSDIAYLIDSFGGDSVAVVIPWFSGTNSHQIYLAHKVISDRGERGSNAIPALVDFYQRNSGWIDVAFRTLKEVGDASRPAFTDALRSEHVLVRRVALETVLHDPEMFDHVVMRLVDPDHDIRFQAAMTVSNWRLWARHHFEIDPREGETREFFSKIVKMARGREDLFRVIEEIFVEVDESMKIPIATTYCLYGGPDGMFADFLQDLALDEGDQSRQITAASALRSIAAYQQNPNFE